MSAVDMDSGTSGILVERHSPVDSLQSHDSETPRWIVKLRTRALAIRKILDKYPVTDDQRETKLR